MQLQEIRLYDQAGTLLDIKALVNGGMADFSTPDGASPNSHGLENLFDSDVSECLCHYNEYAEPSNMMPAMSCEACADFTKGEKWLEYNTADPCVPATDSRGRSRRRPLPHRRPPTPPSPPPAPAPARRRHPLSAPAVTAHGLKRRRRHSRPPLHLS
jgi:hypothetical protein